MHVALCAAHFSPAVTHCRQLRIKFHEGASIESVHNVLMSPRWQSTRNNLKYHRFFCVLRVRAQKITHFPLLNESAIWLKNDHILKIRAGLLRPHMGCLSTHLVLFNPFNTELNMVYYFSANNNKVIRTPQLRQDSCGVHPPVFMWIFKFAHKKLGGNAVRFEKKPPNIATLGGGGEDSVSIKGTCK